MAKPAYMDTGNDADLARLIKDGALFLRPVGSTAPTGSTWTPAGADLQVGYYSDDGFTITPTPGDETNLTGHNGDPLISEAAPGYWGVGFSGLEGNEAVTAAYFDVDVAGDGSVTVSSASASKRYDLIAVGLDQKERLILVHFPNVQIDNSSREALTFNRTTLLAYGLAFKTFKGGASAPYHFKAWGFVASDSSEDWTSTITGTPTGGTYTLSVDGVASAAIAYNADATAVQSALNAIAGVTGTTVTGTTTKAIAFTSSRTLTANGASLTGGTSPAVVVTPV